MDPDRKRIELTAKKTLVDSELPIISNVADVEVGAIGHAFVTKVLDKCVIIEFFNHVKAIVPAREARCNTIIMILCPY